jgi:hypothetical protein
MDNLASFIQNGGNPSFTNLPQAGLKNADFNQPMQQQQQQQHFLGNNNSSGADDSTGWMQRLASSNRIQSLLRSLSSNMNMNQQAANLHQHHSSSNNNNRHHHHHDSNNAFPSPSNANFANLLQSMQAASQQQSHNNLLNGNNNNNPCGPSSSAVSLANLLRQDSHTGLSALRVQDGLNHRNTSVDDFLSLMAAGDIPHQDASMLNMPLANLQAAVAHGGDGGGGHSNTAAILSNAIDSAVRFPSAAALAMAQARAAAASQQQQQQHKRGIDDVVGEITSQGNEKR